MSLPYKPMPTVQSYQPSRTRAGFGIYTALPDLPEGWLWMQSPHQWLIVRSPDGRRDYFVDFHPEGRFTLTRRSRASRWDYVRTLGKLTPGEEYYDTRERIHSQDLKA